SGSSAEHPETLKHFSYLLNRVTIGADELSIPPVLPGGAHVLGGVIEEKNLLAAQSGGALDMVEDGRIGLAQSQLEAGEAVREPIHRQAVGIGGIVHHLPVNVGGV